MVSTGQQFLNGNDLLRATVARMLQQNDWRLIDGDELVQRLIAHQSIRPLVSAQGIPVEHLPSTGSIETAALYCYAEVLYAAFAGQAGEAEQPRAYTELFRYVSRVLRRKMPTLGADEQEELAYDVISELYYRVAPNRSADAPPAVRIPGAFFAVALQQTENALRRWRNATRHLEPVADANDDTSAEEQGRPVAAAGWSDADTPDGYAEQRELCTQVRACFAQALGRYPRARLQLRVVWLHVIEDQTYEIIAESLSMRVENVRVLFSRGLARLRSDPEWQALFNEQPAVLTQPTSPVRTPEVTHEREHGHG